MTIAATISIVILALLSTFQLALAAGAPLGKFAWGGRSSKTTEKIADKQLCFYSNLYCHNPARPHENKYPAYHS